MALGDEIRRSELKVAETAVQQANCGGDGDVSTRFGQELDQSPDRGETKGSRGGLENAANRNKLALMGRAPEGVRAAGEPVRGAEPLADSRALITPTGQMGHTTVSVEAPYLSSKS